MKIVIKSTNLELTPGINDFVEKKINSLGRFSRVFQGEKYFNERGKPRVEAWVEIGKSNLHHKKGPYFFAECQMRLSGRSVRATAYSSDLRLAVCQLKDKLQQQLKEYKEKVKAKARAIKKMRN